jgi:2-C-methyl-D-erythritol 4-phosphate cytidylyltransferase
MDDPQPESTSISFVLPAAGAGRRMGAGVPKAFLDLAGVPIVVRTVARLRACVPGAPICVVLPALGFEELREQHGPALLAAGATALTPGGTSRQTSVARGLEGLSVKTALVAIHDAVRPFVSQKLVREAVAAARGGGAVPALPVTDTLKRIDVDGRIGQTVDRSGLVAVQTPQIFPWEAYKAALAASASLGEEVTDDASLLEAAGVPVTTVPGETLNLKITTPGDLRLAEAILAAGLAG